MHLKVLATLVIIGTVTSVILRRRGDPATASATASAAATTTAPNSAQVSPRTADQAPATTQAPYFIKDEGRTNNEPGAFLGPPVNLVKVGWPESFGK